MQRFGGYWRGWITRRYALALLLIATLATSAFAIFETVISQHEDILAVVNISGRQRMLSQQAALYVEQVVRSENRLARSIALENLSKTAEAFTRQHIALTQGNTEMGLPSGMSPEIRELYFNGPNPLDTQVRRYIEALGDILATPDNGLHDGLPAVRYVLERGPGELLESLDVMVSAYQRDGEAALRDLQVIEMLLWASTLIILGLEALLIFRPMAQRIDRQLTENETIRDRLAESNLFLESQVYARTKDLNAAKKAAEQANVNKSRFLAAAGHDLRQPLEALGMFTGILDKRLNDPTARAILFDMESAQRSMRGLLESILDISKIESGLLKGEVAPTALQPILKQVVSEVRPMAAKKGLEVRLVSTAAWVMSHPDHLERIVRNLVGNAVRYTDTGRVLVGCRHNRETVRLEIHDTGPGIPPAERHQIFEAFKQLENPHRDRSEGIGLGLAICRGLAHHLGHEIDMAPPRPSGGSCFFLKMTRALRPSEE